MRLLGTLFVLLLATAVFGYASNGGNPAELSCHRAQRARRAVGRVVVDEGKVKADVGVVADKVGALTQRAKELISGKATRNAAGALEVDAQVVSIDSEAGSVRLRLDGVDLDFDVPSSTAIVVDGADARLAALLAGRDVRVTVTADGDQLLLQRIATR